MKNITHARHFIKNLNMDNS